MKIDNRLIAYIQYQDGEPFIDIVKISKKGTSFLYDGVWWARGSVLKGGYCTNEKGEKAKIFPLSRTYNPYENYDGVIEIKESAKERYRRWRAGEFKS
jgi:hypothetical protein